MTVRMLHNPRCSKSRATLALLQDRGIEPDLSLYLETPPTREELQTILQQLGMKPIELVRKGEAEFRELGLGEPGVSDDRILDAMIEHPRLIERPIVLANGKASIGRPPESVLDIL
ncbi:arsenate reductase (glutaredoxin) [Wenzhouxiangellaceae bacterium CH-27]|uniref:Arsenate reductase n=2 Tax=Elongatibacter sediminis TaxID=3119006 RepID=A0AAW9RFR6_9GAMM